ncbi:MAG: hypothetical protein RLZZ165_476 [Bacteroidota bacterium]
MIARRSFESLGFASVAAMSLAPLFFHAGWILTATAIGVKTDALGLTLGSLLVTGCVVAGHVFLRGRRRWAGILAASAAGACTGALLGSNPESWFAISLAYLALAVIQFFFLPSLAARFPEDLDGLAMHHKVKTGLLILLSVFSIVQTARLSTFMGDHRRVKASILPDIKFFRSHSCLTAYVHAVKLAKSGENNLYDSRLWPDETAIGSLRELSPDTTGPYAPFYLDNYLYPPQFLLLPGAIQVVSEDFYVQRMLWFALCGLWLAAGFWITARWVGVNGKYHALLLIPLLWSSINVLIILQTGNAHHMMIVMAVLAMIAFDVKRPLWGGALLAFAILSKISPGILVVPMLVQRRWRDLGWTFAFGVLYTLITILIFGFQPVESWLTYEFPKLLSGDSVKWFPFSETNILVNYSPFGIPFKLSMLGIRFGDIWGTARILNTVFTVMIVAIAAWAPLRHRDRPQQLSMWLCLLTLSAMQSPFAPGYVLMPAIWLLTILSSEIKGTVSWIVFTIVFALVFLPFPATGNLVAVYSLFHQSLVMAVIVFGLVRKISSRKSLESHPI